MLVIHHTDSDGHCAAAIVKHFIHNAEFMPMNYWYDINWKKIDEHEHIFMVDFSFNSMEDMKKINEEHDFVWIDHHGTAIRKWEDSGSFPVKGIREEGKAGCELTWRYFTSQKLLRWVYLIGRYDVWDHSDPDTVPFQYGIRTFDSRPDKGLWNRLFIEPGFCEEIIEVGHSVLRYIDNQNKIIAGSAADVVFEGLSGCLLFVNFANSMTFKHCFDKSKHEIMIACQYMQTNNVWKVSLYSEDIDVSQIALKHGGGGHPGAAGFQTTTENMIELGFLS